MGRPRRPVGGVVVEQVIAGAGVGGVPFDAVVEEVIECGGGGVGAGVEEVAVVKGIAAGAALKVTDDVGEVDDGGGDLAIGVEAHEVAQGGGVRGVGREGGFNALAEGDGLFVVGGDGDERGHEAGEVEVEGGAPGETALEGEVGGADGAAEVEAAEVGAGVEFERRGDEGSAHGSACDVRLDRPGVLARGRTGVLLHEVEAKLFGFGIGFGESPARGRVGGLDDGIAAFVEGFGLLVEGCGGVVDEGALGVAVEVDDEAAIPGAGDIDAVGHAVEGTGLDQAGGGVDDVGFGVGTPGLVGRIGGGWRRGKAGEDEAQED